MRKNRRNNRSLQMLMAASVGVAAIVAPAATAVQAADNQVEDEVGMQTPEGDFEYVTVTDVKELLDEGYKITPEGLEVLEKLKYEGLGELTDDNLTGEEMPLLTISGDDDYIFENISIKTGTESIYTLDKYFGETDGDYKVIVSDKNIVSASIEDGFLLVEGLSDGLADITVSSSTGKVFTFTVGVDVKVPENPTTGDKVIRDVHTKVGDKAETIYFEDYFGTGYTYIVEINGDKENIEIKQKGLVLSNKKEGASTIIVTGKSDSGENVVKHFKYVTSNGNDMDGEDVVEDSKPVDKPESNKQPGADKEQSKPVDKDNTTNDTQNGEVDTDGEETNEDDEPEYGIIAPGLEGDKGLTEEEKQKKIEDFKKAEQDKKESAGKGEKVDKLPQTGTETSILTGLLGGTLLAMATALGFKRNKRKEIK